MDEYSDKLVKIGVRLEKENEKKHLLLRNTFQIIEFGDKSIIYNSKTKRYYKPIFPNTINFSEYGRIVPKTIFLQELKKYNFETYYDSNILKINFEISYGNNIYTKTISCDEYFPEIPSDKSMNKEELVNTVIICANKNLNLKNKIIEVKNQLKNYTEPTDEYNLLDINELQDKVKIYNGENFQLENELDKLKLELEKYKEHELIH